MKDIVINGGLKLNGSITVSGAKNSAVSIIAASLLSKEEVVITNVPAIRDVYTQLEIIRVLGGKVSFNNSKVIINPENICRFELPSSLVSMSRGSVLIWGALLSRWGKVRSGLPGGDKIGERPIDFLIKACHLMGANTKVSPGNIEITADNLHGADIYLDRPSTTTTENIMILASLAEGTTVIYNAEKVPEIMDLALFLRKLGVKIIGDGTGTITVKGLKRSTGQECTSGLLPSVHSDCGHQLIADPFEAGTFAVAAALTKGEIILENAVKQHMIPTIVKLAEAGAVVKSLGKRGIYVKGGEKINPINVYVSAPYPAFQSDMQAIFAALLSKSDGVSTIVDSVFGARFCYVEELKKMGADVKVEGNKEIITGVKDLVGANVTATDIRGGASLLLAGLVANGETRIKNTIEIDRGYENIEKKMSQLGASIKRVDS